MCFPDNRERAIPPSLEQGTMKMKWKIIVVKAVYSLLFAGANEQESYLAFSDLRDGLIDQLAASDKAKSAINEDRASALLKLYAAIEALRGGHAEAAASLLKGAANAFYAASCTLEERLVAGLGVWVRVRSRPAEDCTDMLGDLIKAWRYHDREGMLELARKMLPRTFESIYDEREIMEICEAMILAEHAYSSYLELEDREAG